MATNPAQDAARRLHESLLNRLAVQLTLHNSHSNYRGTDIPYPDLVVAYIRIPGTNTFITAGAEEINR